jgi:hypothetical protein
MSDELLTRYNLHLSRPKNPDGKPVSEVCEINCTSISSLTVADYIRESLSQNTRTAYPSDLEHFESWGGQIPAPPEMIAAYLAAHAGVHTVATLNRRLAALAKVHRSRGFSNPTTVCRPNDFRRNERLAPRRIARADLAASLFQTGSNGEVSNELRL